MSEPFSSGSGAAAAWVLLPKIIAAVVGAVFALTLSGDITHDGHLRINLRVLVTFTAAVSLTLSAGQVVWDAFLLVGGAAQCWRQIVTRSLPQQTLGSGANNITYRVISGQSALPATPPASVFGQATQIVRTLLQAQ